MLDELKLPEVRTYQDLIDIEPLFQNTGFWLPLLRQICDQEGIRFSNVHPGFPSSSAVFILDGRLVIKVFSPLFCESCQVESEILQILSYESEIPSPKFVAAGTIEGHHNWPYLVMERVSGKEIREVNQDIEPSNLLEIATEFGRILRQFHSLDISRLMNLPKWEISLKHFAMRRQAVMQRLGELRESPSLQRTLSLNVLDELEALFETGLDKFLCGSKVVAHCDLTEDHLFLVRHKGEWRISGLIDYQGARVGLKEFDWKDTWFCLWQTNVGAMKAFLDGYGSMLPLDDDFRRKCLFFGTMGSNPGSIIDRALSLLRDRPVRSLNDFLDLLWPPQLLEST
jgi:hygromycin-B 7''-O-kinase